YLELKVAARKKWASNPVPVTANATNPSVLIVPISNSENEKITPGRPTAPKVSRSSISAIESSHSAIESERIALPGGRRPVSDSELTRTTPAGESALPSLTLITATSGSAEIGGEQTPTTISQSADSPSGSTAQTISEQQTET